MKVQVQHIYDSTMADKNAIVSNALQFNIVAETATEQPPAELTITYDCYYDGKLFFSSSKLPLIYYFKEDSWTDRLTLTNGYYYFDTSKIQIKWREGLEAFQTNFSDSELKLVAWQSQLILFQEEGELERPASEADLGKQYELKMMATSLSISSDNEEHSDWSPKLIDYHFWLNKSTSNYIDIPIAPLVFPDELATFNDGNEISNYDFDLGLWIDNGTKSFEIFALTTSLKKTDGQYFFKEQEDETFKISYKQATPASKITATHILIQENQFSDSIAGTNQIEDENGYHLFLSIDCNPKNGATAVNGIGSFKYLTVINLIYKEAPFFNVQTLPSSKINWTLDKNDLGLFPWKTLVAGQLAPVMWYNAGSSLKFDLSENQPQLCGRPLQSYVIYESTDNKNYNRVAELASKSTSEVIYTILRRSEQSTTLRYAIGVITNYNGELLETPLNRLLKINYGFHIGRITNPVISLTNCLTESGNLIPQFRVDDYGGNNKGDWNLTFFSKIALGWWNQNTTKPACSISIYRSFNQDFLNATINTLVITGQEYSEIDWDNLPFSSDTTVIQLTDLEKQSTIYIKAKISFVYGCQDNIDLITCETPTYTYFGLEKLPTVSYLKNQIGVNTPGLTENELIGITSTAEKALIRLLNSGRQYASVNVNTRNLNEFIINCGSWDDAEFGYSNFTVINNTVYARNEIAVVDLTQDDWNNKLLYAKANNYNLNTGEIVSTQYYCINYQGEILKEWSEKAEICRNLTTLYYYTEIAYLQYQDNAEEKFTVEE